MLPLVAALRLTLRECWDNDWSKRRFTATTVCLQRALNTSPKQPMPMRGPSSTSAKSISMSFEGDRKEVRLCSVDDVPCDRQAGFKL